MKPRMETDTELWCGACQDPSKGYVPENVWVISWRANHLKSDGRPDELRQIADAVDRRVGEFPTVPLALSVLFLLTNDPIFSMIKA